MWPPSSKKIHNRICQDTQERASPAGVARENRDRPDLAIDTPREMERDMSGRKTHEQLKRTLERKSDVPRPDEFDPHAGEAASRLPRHRDKRESEYPVSRGGMHQESRQHNKGGS
jgi:hypothetical protein